MKTRVGLAAVTLSVAALLTACAGASELQSADKDSAGFGAPEDVGRAESGDGAVLDDMGAADEAPASIDYSSQEPAIISSGSISLRSDDLGTLREEIRETVFVLNGKVTYENTESDKDGEIKYGELTVSVPSASFDDAMEQLSGLGTLASQSQGSQDVTIEVVDVAARIRAQEKGLVRIEALLVQATDLGDVIKLESEISRRQAELDSLKSQQAYLSSMTSMATINVTFKHLDEEDKAEAEENPIVRGFKNGWDGMTRTLEAIIVMVASLLPVAVVLALFGWPIWILSRRWRGDGSKQAAATESPAPADES